MIGHKILKQGAHPESDSKGCRKNRVKVHRILLVLALVFLLTVAPLLWPVPSVMAARCTSAPSAGAQVAFWSRAYGGSGTDEARVIVSTSDGGYVVAGTTQSFGAGNRDVWVLMLDGSGNMQWQKTYGGGDE
jgi:hypothetical protein